MNSKQPKEALLKIQSLHKTFQTGNNAFGSGGKITALNDVSFNIFPGEILGIIGESGSGKSTLGRSLVLLEHLEKGAIYYNDINLLQLSKTQLHEYRKKIQMIFQHPAMALNPKHRVRHVLSEPLKIIMKYRGESLEERIIELLYAVGLDEELLNRYPHQLSGGQKQRLNIARTLALKPQFIIADEPTSNLDAQLKGQILNLLLDLRIKYGITLLIISHDISTMQGLADRIAVMYKGCLIESGPGQEILDHPRHPYTKELISASKIELFAAESKKPLLTECKNDAACVYYDRCMHARELCFKENPIMANTKFRHSAACHFPLISDKKINHNSKNVEHNNLAENLK